jgi:hypothetical protein
MYLKKLISKKTCRNKPTTPSNGIAKTTPVLYAAVRFFLDLVKDAEPTRALQYSMLIYTHHRVANPDPDPTLMRMRIRLAKMMRIHVDPDPQQ